jgi:hypothetical protein
MMKTRLQNGLKLALVAVFMLSIGVVSAQTTTGQVAKKTDAVRLIDNKGTIKYLQSNNGITQILNTTADVTTTTWQLGGTLTDNTYIDVDGNVFALDGIELVTDITTASSNAVTLESHDGDAAAGGTGWTVLIRDEDTGAVKKIQIEDLLQVQAGQQVLATPVIGSNTVTGSPANYAKVNVYRNGAKLVANLDYTVAADAVTLVDRSAATNAPADWTLNASVDVIEVHWVK